MSASVSDERAARRIPVLSWVWWAVVGAVLSLGVIGILTIGAAFLAIGSALVIVGVRSARLRHPSAFVVLAGAAAAPLLLAWSNRGGPGTVCRSDGHGGSSCDQEWSPWPFVVVAVLLLAAGVLLARRAVRTAPTS